MASKLTFIEQEWTRQPRHLVKVDPRNPLGQFAAVCIPGIGVFGTANPVAEFKVNTSVSINKTGAIWYQSGTSANAGVSLGSSTGLKLSVSSGVIECINWSTASNQMSLFRTGTGVYKNGDFYIDLLNHKVRLIKANVAVIIGSSNSVSPNGVARIAWSYNGTTGRASLAVNGVLTTGISAQTFDHSGNAIVCGYDEVSTTGTFPSNISLFAISPKECLDNAALIRLSLNPWQIFEPEKRLLFNFSGSSGAYTLTASGGTYTVQGASAGIFRSRVLSGTGGSYTLTGGQAVVSRNRKLVASGGIYNYTGQSITITHTSTSNAYTLTAQGGSYALSGGSTLILKSKRITSVGGVYTLTGSDAVVLKSKYLTAASGTYSLTGGTATVLKSKVLISTGGVYSYTGSSTVIKKSKYLSALGGSYSLVGSSAVLVHAGIGGIVWPPTHLVVLGTAYGPTGSEYVGTLDVNGIKYDITTGQLVKPISDKVVMSL